ncbi:hypothetical protein OIU84_005803 [Salix udensis]|uniref:Methyltransferase n=1 Tax=Salix udensis TaxID=889485 RepID=A0AAD6JX09_9ROSI|nr:hypothetical protein OIU84_005803 [Salix udensis]
MSRPLHRGATGIRISGNSNDLWDSQMKDKTEKEDMDRNRSSDQSYLALKFPFRVLYPDNNSPSKYVNCENGFASDPFSVGSPRSRHKLTLLLLKLSLAVIVVLALTGSFLVDDLNINIVKRVLQEQLVSDLWDIGELSLGSSRLHELEFCSQESEIYVPCFNASENLALGYSDGSENDRHCGQSSRQSCTVLPPVNYRIPLHWPTGRDIIWVANVRLTAQEVLSSGSLTKRMMMLDEEQISFRSVSPMFDSVEDYSHQIAEMIGLRNESNFVQAGVRTIFGYWMWLCQVQLTLERGLPAMIGSFTSNQLPYPSLSFDMLHCARCGVDWDQKGGIFLIEADRVFEARLVRKSCYGSRKPGAGPPTCSKAHDVESPYYRPLQRCIAGTQSPRWIPIQERTTWPSRSRLNKSELTLYGLHPADFREDAENWKTTLTNYWSVLSPIIFSDHPKRPGEEDPSPPYNMARNVLDMNAHFGGFNSALLEAGKSVWVMNVVPTGGPNYLPLILDRGFVGALHDWCEPFPTYPRSYDLVHAEGLLSLQIRQQRRCTMLDLFTEVDRLLRPEGWVILRDTAPLVESARRLTTRLKWDARVIEIENNSDDRLLICQKPFLKRQGVSF